MNVRRTPQSEQPSDDGREATPEVGGVPQQAGTDQDVVRTQLLLAATLAEDDRVTVAADEAA
jgi:hypothetical protein